MKKQIFTLSFALCAALGYSQNSNPWPATGNVGMGTSTPTYQLDVIESFPNTSKSLVSDAFIGSISGTARTGLYFQVGGNFSTTPATYFNKIQSSVGGTNMGYVQFNSVATVNTTRGAVAFGYGSELMRINQDGKVRIGSNDRTTPAGYRLFVEEGILTEKVKVAISTTANWADYVFAPEYKLMPLEEVEQFTKENKHLPNVPSAEEMVSEGLDVAQMDARLLEKIEELTLYIIDQNKTNETQAKEIAEFAKQAEKQSKEIEELKALVTALIAKE